MSCEAEAAEALRQAGYKMTPQRLLILRAVRHSQGHISAPQIAEQVHEIYPMVDVSTVYRTLDVLKRMRLVTSTDMGGGDVVFEWVSDRPHHHLICSHCERVIEIDHRYFDELAARVRADFGFAPQLHHFAIFGVCQDCQREES